MFMTCAQHLRGISLPAAGAPLTRLHSDATCICSEKYRGIISNDILHRHRMRLGTLACGL